MSDFDGTSRHGKAKFLAGNTFKVEAGTVVDAIFYTSATGEILNPHVALPDGRRWFQAILGLDIVETKSNRG